MIFTRAEIYGFGKWIDYTLDFSTDGPIYFYGENEAGKSTLQQFLLYMLFGLPPRKIEAMKPKESSRIGGTLTVQLSDGETMTIERVGSDVRSFLWNGQVVEGEAYVQKILHRLSRDVYTAIYAFSALDLMDLHKMKKEDLSDLLFSVGVIGSDAIYRVERTLAKKSGDLYKNRAQKPIINEQIQVIQSANEALEQAKKKEFMYRHYMEQKHTLERERLQMIEALKEVNGQFIYLQKVLQSLETIEGYKRLLTDLSSLPETIDFPEDGIARYQSLKDKLIPLQSEKNVLQAKVEQFERQLQEVQQDQVDEAAYIAAKQLHDESHRERSRQEQMKRLTTELSALNVRMQDQLNHVKMTESELEELSFPFQIETTWKQLIDKEVELSHQSNQLTEEYETIERERKIHEKQMEQIEAELYDETYIARLQEQLHEIEENERAQASNEKWLQLEQTYRNQTKTSSVLFGMSAFVVIVLAFYFDHFEWLIVASMFAILFIRQIYILMKAKRSDGEIDRKLEISEHERRQWIKLLERQQQLTQELSFIENEIRRLETQKANWQEKSRLFTLAEHQWHQAVNEERKKYPFLIDVDLAYWLDLLSYMKELQTLKETKKRLMEQLSAIKEESELFKQQCLHLLDEQQMHLDDVTKIEQKLSDLVHRFETNEQARKQIEQLILEYKDQQRQIEEKIEIIETEIDTLWKFARCENEEQYFQIAQLVVKKETLEHERKKLSEQLHRIFAPIEIEQLFDIEVNEIDVEKDLLKFETERTELETKKTELEKKLANVSFSIEQLEQSQDYSEALHTYEHERAKLNKDAKQWAIYQIAQTALTKAKHSFQEKYFLDVITYTTDYFQWLTNGKYVNVFAPTKNEPFRVETSNKVRYTVNELSKGTVDQLYIALRLAISEVMSKKIEVPMMIDDALIHFDEKRMKRAIELMKKIGENRQVLFFTCRLDIVKQLEELEEVQLNVLETT